MDKILASDCVIGDGFLFNGEKFIKVAPSMEAYAIFNRDKIIADLLEALKWYVKHDDANEGDEYYMDGQNKAKAAILKAGGNFDE